MRECLPGEGSDIRAIDIPSLLAESGKGRISILKIDIEGSESVLLSAPDVHDWLARVDCLAIELHDDTHFGAATDVFRRVFADLPFTITRSGELTVCRRERAAG